MIVPDETSGLEPDVADVYDFYSVGERFPIRKFRWIEGRYGRHFYGIKVAAWMRLTRRPVVYTMDLYVAMHAAFMGHRVIFEAHQPPPRWEGKGSHLISRLCRSKSLVRLIVITEPLREVYRARGVPDDKIRVVPDAGDPPTTDERIALPGSGFRVGYSGHLYDGKGLEVIERIHRQMPHVDFHIIGGLEVDVERWKSRISGPNIFFHGFVPHHRLSPYLNALDAVLLPNQKIVRIWGNAVDNIGSYTSPLKMFDYMAHGKAIVSSDLPVLREVLHEGVALFADPDRTDPWIEAIELLRRDPARRTELGSAARSQFERNNTWTRRAELVLDGA